MSVNPASEEAVKSAQDALNSHLREIINWHFSPETGCPFWLDWAAKQDWNPPTEIQTSDDLVRFPHFDGDEWLRYLPHDVWIPKQYEGQPQVRRQPFRRDADPFGQAAGHHPPADQPLQPAERQQHDAAPDQPIRYGPLAKDRTGRRGAPREDHP